MLRRRVDVDEYDRPAGGVPVADTYEGRDEVVERRSRFDPAAIISFLAGFALTIFGLLGLVRAGFDGFPKELVTVGGMTVTVLVALSATVVGAGLLLSGVSGYEGRGGAMFLSTLLVIAGIIVIAAGDSLSAAMRAEDAFGWLIVILGVVTLVANAALPARTTQRWYARRSVRQ